MALQDSITYLNDLDLAIQHTVGIEQLKGTTILVTGATGTIGSFVADMLLRYNQTNNAYDIYDSILCPFWEKYKNYLIH